MLMELVIMPIQDAMKSNRICSVIMCYYLGRLTTVLLISLTLWEQVAILTGFKYVTRILGNKIR